MQVNPLVPLRTVRTVPFSSTSMTVASLPTAAGAAVIALAMICPSVIFVLAAPMLWSARAASASNRVEHSGARDTRTRR